MLKKTYDWLMRLSASKQAPMALAAVSFAESSFFPIPPDVMLVPMVLADRKNAWWYAFIATVASVIGGIAGYGIGYFLLEIPGSLIVERASARKWFARIMITWGLVAALTGFVTSSGQFYVARFLLGTAEAGFFPGAVVYLSHWFQYEERTRAKSWFMMTQPLAVVIGTPVSRWILENVHWSGWAGWRWVFVLEGVPPILLGIFALYYLTDRPQEAKWLPEEEKRWLLGELKEEEARKTAAGRVRSTNVRFDGLAGLNSTAIDLACGMAVCRISTSLSFTSSAMLDNPVMLPPGRARLATRPTPTGSLSPVITMGIDRVACCAARADAMVATMITAGLPPTSSAAKAGKRS